MSEDNTVTETIVEPKLWAGKYKSVEDLEEAYKNSSRVFNENKELQTKLDTLTKVPDDYETPNDISLRAAELAEIKAIAKGAGLTQEQFVRTAKEMEIRVRKGLETADQAKKEVGDEKITLITDHVKKNYPESLHQIIINQAIKDKSTLADIMKERDTKLNSKAPGLEGAHVTDKEPNKFDGKTELEDAAKAYQRQPNEKNRNRYIDLARQVGEERFKDKIGKR